MAKKRPEEEKSVIASKVEPREITQELQESYLDYAMSVIVSRALPDVRDGLKPVQRRILWTMWDNGITAGAKPRKSAYTVGECFIKDTLITTTQGLIPIQDIKIGDEVYTQNKKKKVAKLYWMPPKELLKVKLQNGLSNTVTKSQKLKILNPNLSFSWKEAKDLTDNDYLVLKKDYPKVNNLIPLQFQNREIFLNEGLAYLLGLFISDGWVTKDYGVVKDNRIGFVAQDRRVLEKIKTILQANFNYSPAIEIKKHKIHKPVHILRINNKLINNFLVENFDLNNRKAENKEIPKSILQSPAFVVFAFLSGLIEGDGCVTPKKNLIRYTSISEKLIDQLMVVFLSLGVFSKKYANRKPLEKNHQSYNLEINGQNARKLALGIDLEDEIKKEKLINLRLTKDSDLKSDLQDLIPYAGKLLFGELSNKHLGGGWYEDYFGKKFRMGVKYADGTKIRYSTDLVEKPIHLNQIVEWNIKDKLERINSRFFGFIDSVINNNLAFVKVSSVENAEPQETYDLEVEGDHEFIANGVISHNCMGKYHPHGDMSIYDALARMAQDFSLRYPLILGQGNWGSVDGDPPAAQRYTECKLAKIAEELLFDIEKDTVEWQNNYDASRQEPKYLPAKLPNLLLNGAVGIAVGMATNIPPHNLTEVVDATIHLIESPEAESVDLMTFVQGPDFPTGGIMYDKKAIIQAYITGRGSFTVRGVAEVDDDRITITAIPYQVNKAELIIKMAGLVTDKKIEGIRDIRDESDKDGMSVVIELKKDAVPQKVLNQLYQYTDLQKDFHLNMLALANGGLQPQVMSIKDVLVAYIDHRKIIVRRRAEFDLRKAKDRAHILTGLSKALDMIDEVIKTIRKSADRDDAFKKLVKNFDFSELQANAILEMRLQTLAALERQKIEDELAEKKKIIAELETLLKSPAKILGVIKTELKEVKEKYGDERKTKVVAGSLKEFREEDLIAAEDVIITLSRSGYVKRILPSSFKSQHRGGKGLIGAEVAEEDFLDFFLSANTHDNMLFFTDRGRVFQTKAYEIPAATRTSKGKSINNFLEIPMEEKITAIVAYKSDKRQATSDKYLVMVTKNGLIKKTSLEDFSNVRRSGIIALSLKKDDQLKWVKLSSGSDEIILTTSQGQAIRFKESQVRAMGRLAAGVIAIREKKDDAVVSMDIVNKELKNAKFLVIMERGYGKQTTISQYKVQGRGGSGVKTAKVTPKTGPVVGAQIVDEETTDLFVLSTKGQVIHTQIKDVRSAGRSTQGVRIMNLNSGDKIAGFICL